MRAGDKRFDVTVQFHHVFFMGDMNYRLALPSSSPGASADISSHTPPSVNRTKPSASATGVGADAGVVQTGKDEEDEEEEEPSSSHGGKGDTITIITIVIISHNDCSMFVIMLIMHPLMSSGSCLICTSLLSPTLPWSSLTPHFLLLITQTKTKNVLSLKNKSTELCPNDDGTI